MTLIVNGEKIEDSVILQEVECLRPDYEKVFKDQDRQEREAQLFDWSRENVIERVLINQQAKEYGQKIPQAQIESAFAEMKKQYRTQGKLPEELSARRCEKIKEEIELQMKVERLLLNVYKDMPKPPQEDILEFYEENKEQFKSAEQVRVGHIVKHINWQTDETAAYNVIGKVHDELKDGAVFEVLAAKYSDCPENDGDLGYIKKGQMVEEFEDVAFNLGIGEISDIFRTRFGFHIAKLYDRKPAVVYGPEEMKDRIVSELEGQMRRKAIDEFIDGLKSRAKIEEL